MKAPLWSSIIWYYYLFRSGLAHEVANPQSREEEEEIGSDSFWVLDGDGGKERVRIHRFWDSFGEEDDGIFCDVNLMYDYSHFYIGTGIQWYKNSTALLTAFDEWITYFNETKYTSRCQCWTAGPFYLRGTYLYPEYCGRIWQDTFLHFFQHYLISIHVIN